MRCAAPQHMSASSAATEWTHAVNAEEEKATDSAERNTSSQGISYFAKRLAMKTGTLPELLVPPTQL